MCITMIDPGLALPTTQHQDEPASERVDVWGVAADGTAYRFNGTTWAAVATNNTKSLNGVWSGGPSDAWAVGDDGTLLRWAGSSWTSVSSGTTNNIKSVWGMPGGTVWAVGAAGTIIHSP